MIVLEQKFRPSGARAQPGQCKVARDSFVACNLYRKDTPVEKCYDCKHCERLNFNTVHCAYA